MLIHMILLLQCLEIMQYQIRLHSIAGKEWLRRNVGEVTPNSRDPGKIIEGSQTSLSKLINEMNGLKNFENIIFPKYQISLQTQFQLKSCINTNHRNYSQLHKTYEIMLIQIVLLRCLRVMQWYNIKYAYII